MNLFRSEEPEPKRDQSDGTKKGDIPPEYLGSVLRAEFLPVEEATPDKRGIRDVLQWINVRKVAVIFVVVVVIGFGLICLIGPGMSVLENSLESLSNKNIQSTRTATPTRIPAGIIPTQVPPTATKFLTKTPTRIPPSMTPTNIPLITPTQDDGCADPLEITLDDVGKTMCVRGIITGMEEREVGFIVYFSDERGIFYLVTYDFVWDQAEPGDCIQITGEIQQLSNTPVLVFGWTNIPEFCP